MALTSISTYQDAVDQYNDNLSYEGDAGKSTLFLQAIRWLIGNRPETNSAGSRNFSFETLEKKEKEVSAYLKSLGRNKRASFVQARVRL